MPVRFVSSAALLGAVATALGGCSDPRLAGSSIERLLTGDLARRGHPGARAECPDVEDTFGRRFTCRLEGAGPYTRFEGKVAKDDGIAPVGPGGGYRP